MEYDAIFAVFVIGALLYISLDFKKPYTGVANDLALHPMARFAAGVAVTLLASYNPIFASVALIIVFFWFADVNLLSSFAL